MAGHQDRAAVALERRGQLPDRRHVQVVGRLVEQQQLGRGLGEQQGREDGTEPLAAGQRAGPPVGPLAAEQEPGQARPDLVHRRGRSRCPHVVDHAQRVVEDIEPLRQVTDHRPQPDIDTRAPRAHDRAEQGGLARAVRADQGDPFRPADDELREHARLDGGGVRHEGGIRGRRGDGIERGGRRVPVRAGQAGHGQDGAPGRDGRARQVDPDLCVVADRLLRLFQPVTGRLEALGVQLAGPARGLLGGSLAGVGDDPGQAARGGDLAAHAGRAWPA